jgi:O-antigen ligase
MFLLAFTTSKSLSHLALSSSCHIIILVQHNPLTLFPKFFFSINPPKSYLCPFYAIDKQSTGAKIIKFMTIFLGLLATLDLISVIIRLLGLRSPLQTLEYQYVAPFAAIYFFIKYLTDKNYLKSGFIAAIVIIGCISEFQKPIVVSLFFALLSVSIILMIVYFVHPHLNIRLILKKGLLAILLFLFFVILLDIIMPSRVLAEYRLIFYDRYLKTNPYTGEPTGRIDGGRLEYYFLAWEAIAENRWLGGGLGAAFVHPYVYDRYAFPHSLILDFLLSYGLLGIFLLLFIIISIIVYIFRNINWRKYSLEKAGAGGYLIFVFLVSLVGFFWGHLPMVYTTAITLGTLLKMATLDAQTWPRRPLRLRLWAYRRQKGPQQG